MNPGARIRIAVAVVIGAGLATAANAAPCDLAAASPHILGPIDSTWRF